MKFKTQKGTELPILDVKGKDYLEVKWRLVWFREEHPNWSIMTEFVSMDDKGACAKATVYNDENRILSTSHKYEDKQGFFDYREKAETGAIGRALALLGYGTQFCADDLDEGSRIVDAPVTNKHAIYPEQPGLQDGFQGGAESYKIPFGKYQKRALEEIDLGDLRSYVEYIENKAHKDNKPLTGQVLDFVDRAVEYIGAMENSEPGASG